jgi:hypothetical protein
MGVPSARTKALPSSNRIKNQESNSDYVGPGNKKKTKKLFLNLIFHYGILQLPPNRQ